MSIIGHVNVPLIIKELKFLLDGDEDQTMLQGIPGQINNYGVGRISELTHSESEFTEVLYDTPYLNSVLTEYGMSRTRLLLLRPGECYSYHRDPTKRIHIPIICDEFCLAVIDDVVHRFVSDGPIHLIDTTRYHTFINAGEYDRYHIVGIAPDL